MTEGDKRRPNGTGRHIDRVLAALSAYHCEWRVDEHDPFGWLAQCPVCRRSEPHPPRTLRLRISNDDWLSDEEYRETGTLSVGCGRRCVPPSVLRKLLMRNPERIRYEQRIRDLTARLHWWIDYAKRANAADMRKPERPS